MCCCSPPPPASKAEQVVCRTRARKLHSHSNPHFCNLAIYYLSILYLGLLLLFLCSLPSFFIFFSRMQRSKSASTTRPSSLTTNKRSNIILRRRSAGSLGNISTAATSPGIGGPAVSGKVLNKRGTHRETEIRRERRSVCVCASAYVCACMWEIERDRLPKVGKKFRYQNRVGNIYTDPGNILTSPSRPGGHPDVTRSLTS